MTEAEYRQTAWFTTTHGDQFYPWAPGKCDVNIEDIAATLAKINRWGGHTREPYSVAQHSWLVAQRVPRSKALWGLLHDATEAYMGGDIVSPIKKGIADLRELEAGIADDICVRFGLPAGALDDHDVKQADHLVLAWEFRDLMPKMRDPKTGRLGWVPEPMASYSHLIPTARLVPWGWQESMAAFLCLADRLIPGGTKRRP